MNNRLSFDVSFYSIDVEDLLVARRVADDQFIGINAGESRHQGIEIALGYDIIGSQSSNTSLTTSLTYTLTDFEFVDFIDGDSDFSGNKLPGNPNQVFNGVVDFRMVNGLYGNVNTQYVGERQITDANDVSDEAYTVTNLKLGYSKSFSRFKIDLHFGINNVFDEAYASQLLINASSFGGNAPRYYYPGLPRNFFGGLGLKWFL